MRHLTGALVVGTLAIIASASAAAQAARVGRLPILEMPSPGVGPCRNDPVNPALRRAGIVRLVTVESGDSSVHHLVSLGLSAKGGAVMLEALMGTTHGRRGESETVNVLLGNDGSILRGRRSAFTTGTPTRLSDDQERGLLPADTVAVRRLIAALRSRCHA